MRVPRSRSRRWQIYPDTTAVHKISILGSTQRQLTPVLLSAKYTYFCCAVAMAAAASTPGIFFVRHQQFEQQRDLTPCQDHWHNLRQPRARKRAAVDAKAVGDGECSPEDIIIIVSALPLCASEWEIRIEHTQHREQ